MPKNRKTRKQKIRASMKHSPVQSTVTSPSAEQTSTIHQAIKLPEKLSSQPAFLQNSIGSLQSHTYLKGELIKTGVICAAIVTAELLLFFFIRHHLIVLPFVSY